MTDGAETDAAKADAAPVGDDGWRGWWRCAAGILWREALRVVQQKGRSLAALVRRLVWLLIFAAGLRAVLGLSIIEPYETCIPYEVYVVPGPSAMIQLFQGMQSSLSMVDDRETGSMRLLLISPYALVSAGRASDGRHARLSGASLRLTVDRTALGHRAARRRLSQRLPALVLSGLMLSAVGLVLSPPSDRWRTSRAS